MYLNVGVFKCYIKTVIYINSQNTTQSYNTECIRFVIGMQTNISPSVDPVINKNHISVPKHCK